MFAIGSHWTACEFLMCCLFAKLTIFIFILFANLAIFIFSIFAKLIIFILILFEKLHNLIVILISEGLIALWSYCYSVRRRRRQYLSLWHTLFRSDQELIRRVYTIQMIKPVRKDWALMIMEEREKYGINLSDLEIQNMSRGRFKSYINEKVNKFAFNSLIVTARNQSKCQFMLKNITASNMKIQKYLICDSLTKEEQLLLFSLRSFTFQVKSNYRYLYKDNMICRACSDPQSEESEINFSQSCMQFHNERNGEILNSEDVFSSLDTQISFIKKFKIVARKWEILLEIEPSTI